MKRFLFVILIVIFFISDVNALQRRRVELPKNVQKATFAGGCFWCMEPPFDEIEGVRRTIVGYTGGHVYKPDYKMVSGGKTGHAEVVEVEFDADIVSYDELLEVFWRNIDPTTKDRQFCDVGSQYRSGIFYHSEEQRLAAQLSKEKLDKSKKLDLPVVTEITKVGEFFPAERYHQGFYKKNPIRYKTYKTLCGRDVRLENLWGKK